MNDYTKLITILNEIRLPDNATICYFTKNDKNNITTCTSIQELKNHLVYMNENQYKDLIFEVNFDNYNNNYQFNISWYDDVLNNNEFVLKTLRNER